MSSAVWRVFLVYSSLVFNVNLYLQLPLKNYKYISLFSGEKKERKNKRMDFENRKCSFQVLSREASECIFH